MNRTTQIQTSIDQDFITFGHEGISVHRAEEHRVVVQYQIPSMKDREAIPLESPL